MGWNASVSQEILSLEHVLWEVLNGDSSGLELTQIVHELRCDSFIILSMEAVALNEIAEVNVLHVLSVDEVVCKACLSTGLWSKDKHTFWKSTLFRLVIDILNRSTGINMSDLTELLIVVHNWDSFIKVNLNSLLDGLGVVISSSTGFSSLHASSEHDFLLDVVE